MKMTGAGGLRKFDATGVQLKMTGGEAVMHNMEKAYK